MGIYRNDYFDVDYTDGEPVPWYVAVGMIMVVAVVLGLIIAIIVLGNKEYEKSQAYKRILTNEQYCREFHSHDTLRYLPAICLSVFQAESNQHNK